LQSFLSDANFFHVGRLHDLLEDLVSRLGLASLGFGVNDVGTLARGVLLLLVIGTIGVGGLLGRQ